MSEPGGTGPSIRVFWAYQRHSWQLPTHPGFHNHKDKGNKEILVSICKSFYDTIIDMETVTVSPKFQVVIPLSIRKKLDLRPGMKLHVFRHEDSVEFMPLKSIKGMRGFLRGIDTSIERKDDRL